MTFRYLVSGCALLALFICPAGLQAQQKPKKEAASAAEILELSEDSRPTIELNPGKVKDKEKEKRQKKRKKNVFYGMKTRKRVTKVARGNNVTIEKFYVLKQYATPNRFLAEKYYYDKSQRKIVRTYQVDEKYGMPLHGSYQKLVNGEVVINGVFFVGGQHGRWEEYGPDMQLRDKLYYYQGYPKESEISYWDSEQTKIKEVIPIQYGQKHGTYLSYFESGRIAEVGEYDNGEKVGRWTEFYDRWVKNQKREWQYKSSATAEDIEPYVLREWDESGNQTIQSRRKKD